MVVTRITEKKRVEDLIGNTPLLGFSTVTAHLPDHIDILAKAEWYNPGGSVKDRAALNMILTAEENGQITPGRTTLLDSTSGNTGIAYAMIGASRGYAVNEDGTYKSAEELRQLYAEQGVNGTSRDIVAYCRIGERSSHSWFALTYLLGYPNVRNYDGSWTEWGNLIGVPIRQGAER